MHEWADVKYCIYQIEQCPKTNKYHYQGYIEFVGKKTYTFIQKLSGLKTAHLEIRRGSQQDAVAYCSKSESQVGGPWEFGDKK